MQRAPHPEHQAIILRHSELLEQLAIDAMTHGQLIMCVERGDGSSRDLIASYLRGGQDFLEENLCIGYVPYTSAIAMLHATNPELVPKLDEGPPEGSALVIVADHQDTDVFIVKARSTVLQ